MLLFNRTVKLRSLGVSPLVLAFTVGLAGAASTGCFFVEHDHHPNDYDTDPDPGDTTTPPEEGVKQVGIQPDQVLDAKPGEGVGIFVEYSSGGKWHIWTACDTFVSKAVCAFDIYAGTRRPEDLRAYAADQVEGSDTVVDLGDGTVELLVDTDSNVDGMVLETEPGVPLTLEVYLDGESAEPFVYWVSDNVVHGGAPSNPVEMLPAAP